MDIKIHGLTRPIIEEAIARTREARMYILDNVMTVSYTHLDVYKRQSLSWAIYARTATAWAPHWDFITISGLIIQIYGQPCIWRSHPLNSVI